MTAIWSPENRFRIWFQIEVFAAEAMGAIGAIPAEDAKTIRAAYDADVLGEIDVPAEGRLLIGRWRVVPVVVQALLADAGSSPRHRFGQNFMIDGNLVRLVAEAGQIAAGDVVIEVGPGTGYYTLAVDMTERKAAEEQFIQSQKMQAIGKLTGGVAHDFNNLLAVISGNLELAGDALARGDAGIANLLEPARRAAERGSTLTRSLLSFARQQPLSPRVTDLNALARDTTDLLRRTLPSNIGIQPAAPPPPVAGAWINCASVASTGGTAAYGSSLASYSRTT